MNTLIELKNPRLRLLVTKKASAILDERRDNPRTARAIIRAMEFSEGVAFQEPRTLLIRNCPLGVHVDPGRGLVVVVSKFQGFPAIPDELVEALLPFTTDVAVA
jgi:hypothetical protein